MCQYHGMWKEAQRAATRPVIVPRMHGCRNTSAAPDINETLAEDGTEWWRCLQGKDKLQGEHGADPKVGMVPARLIGAADHVNVEPAVGPMNKIPETRSCGGRTVGRCRLLAWVQALACKTVASQAEAAADSAGLYHPAHLPVARLLPDLGRRAQRR
jgi:hypothetical protein